MAIYRLKHRIAPKIVDMRRTRALPLPKAVPLHGDVDSMTRDQLREAAKSRGLATGGSKAQLIKRLKA